MISGKVEKSFFSDMLIADVIKILPPYSTKGRQYFDFFLL